MKLADARDLGMVPLSWLYDKSRTAKYDLRSNVSGILPSSEFLLKFKVQIREVIKVRGMVPEILLPPRFNVAKTGILPSEGGILPESRFRERSKSESR